MGKLENACVYLQNDPHNRTSRVLDRRSIPDLMYVLKKSCSSREEGDMNTRAYRGFSNLASSEGLICE